MERTFAVRHGRTFALIWELMEPFQTELLAAPKWVGNVHRCPKVLSASTSACSLVVLNFPSILRLALL